MNHLWKLRIWSSKSIIVVLCMDLARRSTIMPCTFFLMQICWVPSTTWVSFFQWSSNYNASCLLLNRYLYFYDDHDIFQFCILLIITVQQKIMPWKKLEEILDFVAITFHNCLHSIHLHIFPLLEINGNKSA